MGDARDDWLTDLRVTALQALLVPRSRWRLPPRPEVTVRGAFGAALYDVVCVRDHRTCHRCELASDCVVPSWFEPGRSGQQARPYVIRVDAPGRVGPDAPIRLEMLWFGRIPRPTAVVEALVRAARAGLGRGRVVHEVRKARAVGEGAPVVLVDRDEVVGRWPAPASLGRVVRWPAQVTGATVVLRTPAQVAARGEPTPRDLLAAAMLRVRALGRAQGVEVARRWPEPDLPGTWLDLRWIEGGRYSARSRGRHDLSGWAGVLELGPEVAPFADLLAAAEVVHLGRGSSAGLGRIAVHWRSSAA